MTLAEAHVCWRLGLMTDTELECRVWWAAADLIWALDTSILAAMGFGSFGSYATH